jgi:hypothetical protein
VQSWRTIDLESCSVGDAAFATIELLADDEQWFEVTFETHIPQRERPRRERELVERVLRDLVG